MYTVAGLGATMEVLVKVTSQACSPWTPERYTDRGHTPMPTLCSRVCAAVGILVLSLALPSMSGASSGSKPSSNSDGDPTATTLPTIRSQKGLGSEKPGRGRNTTSYILSANKSTRASKTVVLPDVSANGCVDGECDCGPGITGTWTGSVTTLEGPDVLAVTLFLTQSGSNVTGSFESPVASPGNDPKCGPEEGPVSGSVAGSVFSLEAAAPEKDPDTCETVCFATI